MNKALESHPITVNGQAIKNLSLISPADWAKAITGKGQDRITIAEAYKFVGWFRSAMDTRANAIVSTPWEITREGKEDPIWVSGDAPPKELKWIANLSTILALTEYSLLTDQHAWFKKVGLNKIEALQYFAPSTIEPVESEAGTTGWIRRSQGGKPDKLQLDAVVHVSIPNPFQEQTVKREERMGEAVAALGHASVLKALDDFTNNDLNNGIFRPTIVTVPLNTPDSEVTRLTAWLKRKLTRSGGQSSPDRFAVMAADGATIETLAANITDLAAKELVELHRQGVANAFRVPSSMLESREAANRSVSEQDVRGFYERVVMPRERLIESALNSQLFSNMGLQLKFHPERLEAFQNAELAKAGNVNMLWTGGLVTRNEARRPIDGLDEIEGPEGEEYYQAPSPLVLNAERAARTRATVRHLQSVVANGTQ